MSDELAADFKDRIETIEEAYEFMLAYAAQGLEQEDPSEGGGIRAFLPKLADALAGLHDVAAKRVATVESIGKDWEDFLAILKEDAEKARALVLFTMSQPSVGSELIDNLNATNHIQTNITDVFLLDSAFAAHG